MINDYITLCLLGGQSWAELVCNPCVLGGPQQRGQNQKWLHNICLLGGQKWAILPHNPYILGGPRKRGENQKWLHNLYLLDGPELSGIAMQPLCSRVSPKRGQKGPHRLGGKCHLRRSLRAVVNKKESSSLRTALLVCARWYCSIMPTPVSITGTKLEAATSPLRPNLGKMAT